jgi:urease accessory protein
MASRATSLRFGIAALLATVPAVASAHIGVGGTVGFAHGLAHPIGGIDHVLAMVAVGIFAANLGGRALVAVPLAFMALMAVSGGAAMAGMPLPFVEAGIALSIVTLGLLVAARADWPVAAATALVGLFAVFHGHAHGTEMPADAAGAIYALGFVLATGLLHLAGIAIGLRIGIAGERTSRQITQAGGAAVALVGLLVLGGMV